MTFESASLFSPRNFRICYQSGCAFRIFASHAPSFLALTVLHGLSLLLLGLVLWGILELIFFAFGTNFSTVVEILFFAVVVMLSIMVSSTFQGAKIRAVAHVYAGESPCVARCLGHGWKKKHLVACYGILQGLAYGLAYLIFAGVAGLVGSAVLLPVGIAVTSTAMFAGPATIVIESKGVISGFYETLGLTKNHLCFIFRTRTLFKLEFFVFYFLPLLFFQFLVDLLADAAGGNYYGVLVWLTFIIKVVSFWLLYDPLTSTLDSVVYFTLRIRDQGLTQSALVQQLLQEEDGSTSTPNGESYEHQYNVVSSTTLELQEDEENDIRRGPLVKATAVDEGVPSGGDDPCRYQTKQLPPPSL